MSSRSPTKNELGKHIDTLPSAIREKIIEYFDAKGYKIGKSKFKRVSEKYELKENEKWNGKEIINNQREIEIIIENGLCNDYKLRDEMNIIYFLDIEKAMPEYPQPFIKKSGGGFF